MHMELKVTSQWIVHQSQGSERTEKAKCPIPFSRSGRPNENPVGGATQVAPEHDECGSPRWPALLNPLCSSVSPLQ